MPLRNLTYTYLSPVAFEDGNREVPKKGDLMDLLSDADPYNFLPPKVPPLHIVNAFLLSGENDLGMGGGAQWQPFEISEQEYQELLHYLGGSAGRIRFPYNGDISVLELPEWVRTVADLSVWKIEEAFKDPDHFVNSKDKNTRLADGRMVTFKEYWKLKKSQHRDRS